MSLTHLRNVYALTALLMVLTLASTGNAAVGGSHAGASPQHWNPFVKVQSVAEDAGQFKVISLKETKVPTSVRTETDPECLARAETPYASCPHIVDGDYVDAYRVTVSYVSKENKLASDEYPQGDDATTDFVFSKDEIDPSVIAELPGHGKARRAALQKLFQVTKGVETYRTMAMVKECERIPTPNTSADANAYTVVPAGCVDEFGPVTEQATVIQISLVK